MSAKTCQRWQGGAQFFQTQGNRPSDVKGFSVEVRILVPNAQRSHPREQALVALLIVKTPVSSPAYCGETPAVPGRPVSLAGIAVFEQGRIEVVSVSLDPRGPVHCCAVL